MSCSEWESGIIKFSIKEWRRFVRNFRHGFNAIQTELLSLADQHYYKYHRLVPAIPQSGPRPRKPIRKDFPLATNRTTEFQFDGPDSIGAVQLNSKTRRLYYSSGAGNHAKEDARDSEVGKLLFELLNQITWTTGTGGTITGNDEITQCNQTPGRAENYTTAHFGPGLWV